MQGSKTIKELALAHAPIVVRIDTYFSDALRLLYDNRISGIAIVDQEGRLSGNLSASDLRVSFLLLLKLKYCRDSNLKHSTCSPVLSFSLWLKEQQ